MSSHLSRKQQKSQAFKAKQKAKKKGEVIPDDVPEQDLDELEDEGESSSKPEDKSKGKSKAVEDDDEKEEEAKPVKAKKTAKTAWDEDEGEAKKGKKDIKQRFILFVGNLDFKTSREAIQGHFNDAIGYKPQVRLLTTKPTPKSPAQSRGIAFLELTSSADMQACLKLHQSILENRKINVELTAGGGGKGQGRKDKIKERNERVGGQRQRRAEREAEVGEAGEGNSASLPPKLDGGDHHGSTKRKRTEETGNEDMVQDGVRVRGGRRKRVKETQDTRPPRGSGPYDGQAQKFPQRQSVSSRGRGGARGGRSSRPYGLTGANAVNIG